MDIKQIEETSIWGLYEKGRNYHRRVGIYTDTDRNYRFYNGNQWEGAKLGEVEQVQKNFIKPIIKYKVAVIHDNLYAIVFESMNFENREFHKEAQRYCEMLNRYAMRVWETEELDIKLREVTKDSAINDEGIMYMFFDKETMMPKCEVIKKNDIYYGNENDDEIQNQPYILLKKRMPQANAIEYAKAEGLDESKLELILGDNDTIEESGEAAKTEVDDMVTIVYKMYKKDGTVHFSSATRWVDIVDDIDTGLTIYPVAHFNWEKKEGSARGEGEVRNLIPNQIEVNRTEVRRVLAVKTQAYPQKIADMSRIANPSAINSVGSVIETNGMPVDDVHKIVGTIPPAQMSPDVKQLQDDLIQVTRDLAGAGDSATGQINPESASGRAILAVQQANQSPITEQKVSCKGLIERLAKIMLEYLIINSEDGINLEEVIVDEMSGEENVQIINVPQSVLEQLKANVKINVTPKGVYDRYAQEQTIENLLVNGLFSAERIGELKAYAEALDDDSVAPKTKILEIIERIEKAQNKIAMINAQAQMMQQRVNQFLASDPNAQASQLAHLGMQQAEIPMDEEVEDEVVEGNPDDN